MNSSIDKSQRKLRKQLSRLPSYRMSMDGYRLSSFSSKPRQPSFSAPSHRSSRHSFEMSRDSLKWAVQRKEHAFTQATTNEDDKALMTLHEEEEGRDSTESRDSSETQRAAVAPKKKAWRKIAPSIKAQHTHNPIRKIVDQIDLSVKNPDKEFIPLSIGDPCAFGNLSTPDAVVREMERVVRSGDHNGYINSAGAGPAREAIATYMSVPAKGVRYAPDDIIVGSGCSGALEVCLTNLLDPGTNLLVPDPGFCLYQVIAEAHGAGVKHYDLLPEEGWQVDLAHLEAQIDAGTRAILVNNPSNPCGCVYGEAHLRAILDIAERHQLPVIADEIYANLTFEDEEAEEEEEEEEEEAGAETQQTQQTQQEKKKKTAAKAKKNAMVPMATLSSTVPILTASGMAKEFIVPGWRVGWFAIHDPIGALDECRSGFVALTQITIGANALVQGALPAILTPAAGSQEAQELELCRREYKAMLAANARFTAARFAEMEGKGLPVSIPGAAPGGAMYGMVKVDVARMDASVGDDKEFVQRLLVEEAVMVLPGQCFGEGARNCFRIVLSPPMPKLEEAFSRIEAFVARHAVRA